MTTEGWSLMCHGPPHRCPRRTISAAIRGKADAHWTLSIRRKMTRLGLPLASHVAIAKPISNQSTRSSLSQFDHASSNPRVTDFHKAKLT
jgi:hypothetical protein